MSPISSVGVSRSRGWSSSELHLAVARAVGEREVRRDDVELGCRRARAAPRPRRASRAGRRRGRASRRSAIGQRDRIALPIWPSRCARVVANATCRPSASARLTSGSSPRGGRSTSWSATRSALELRDHEGRARGIGSAAAVQPRPAVHVVGRDADLAARAARSAPARAARARSERCGEVGSTRPASRCAACAGGAASSASLSASRTRVIPSSPLRVRAVAKIAPGVSPQGKLPRTRRRRGFAQRRGTLTRRPRRPADLSASPAAGGADTLRLPWPAKKTSPLGRLLDAPRVREAARALSRRCRRSCASASSRRRPTSARCARSSACAGGRSLCPRSRVGSGRGARVRLANGTHRARLRERHRHLRLRPLRSRPARDGGRRRRRRQRLPGPPAARASSTSQLSRALLRHAGPRLRARAGSRSRARSRTRTR